MTQPSRWPAPAKINLFLHIVGRRDDGYHELQTHFQFLDLCDQLTFEVSQGSEIERLNDLPGVAPEDDLVVRAARLLQQHAEITRGAKIRVDKMLPMGGGLGGGSSNAATTLVALNELWNTQIDTPSLAKLGLQLGADVPIFIFGHAAWAEGVGEQLTPLDAAEGPVLVVHPNCEVATGQVFTDSELTRDTPTIKIHDLSSSPLHNDCEAVTRRLYPEVARALDWLSQYGEARMSGTGACVFVPLDSMRDAERVAQEVPEQWNHFVGMRCNRSPLLERLTSQ